MDSGDENISSDSEGSGEEIDNLILPSISSSVPITTDDASGYDFSGSDIQDLVFMAFEGKMSVAQIKERELTVSHGRRQMTTEIECLIGHANMNFVKGNYDETLRICKEVIRSNPELADPYRTLSEMYEELGDDEKSLQLGMIGAGLGKQCPEAWMGLAEKSLSMQNISSAIYCYQRANRADPANVPIYHILLKLYDPQKDKRLIITTYQKLVKMAPPSLGAEILDYAKKGAHMLHEESDMLGALNLMELAFERASEHVKMDDVNLIVELYISFQKFEKALQVISQYCDVTIEAEDDLVEDEATSELVPWSFRVISYTTNKEIPLQIRAKLIIISIHLKAFHLVEGLLPPLLESVEEDGDLLIDIIEVFMSKEKYEDALNLLNPLIRTKTFNEPQIWLHLADCLRKLGKKEEAVSAYLVVMERAPQIAHVRLIVSELLNDLGRGEEAISALVQDPKAETLDVGILFERCQLLKGNPSREAEYLVVARLLLSRHFGRIRNKKQLFHIVRYALSKVRTDKPVEVDNDEGDAVYVEGSKMPTADEEYAIFQDLCKKAFESKQMALLERLTTSALYSRIFCINKERLMEMYAVSALSAFFNKDPNIGFIFFKNLTSNGYDGNCTWNLYNLVLSHNEDINRHRSIMRSFARRPKHNALSLIVANYLYVSGTYKQALSKYLLHFKSNPTPLLALLIASCFLNLSYRQTKDQNTFIGQAFAFIAEYRTLREEEGMQEVHYNLGRMNHHLNLLPLAVHHYKKVFETPAHCEMFDLKREAAYNLSRIYLTSNAHDLARYYVNKYITI